MTTRPPNGDHPTGPEQLAAARTHLVLLLSDCSYLLGLLESTGAAIPPHVLEHRDSVLTLLSAP